MDEDAPINYLMADNAVVFHGELVGELGKSIVTNNEYAGVGSRVEDCFVCFAPMCDDMHRGAG